MVFGEIAGGMHDGGLGADEICESVCLEERCFDRWRSFVFGCNSVRWDSMEFRSRRHLCSS